MPPECHLVQFLKFQYAILRFSSMIFFFEIIKLILIKKCIFLKLKLVFNFLSSESMMDCNTVALDEISRLFSCAIVLPLFYILFVFFSLLIWFCL